MKKKTKEDKKKKNSSTPYLRKDSRSMGAAGRDDPKFVDTKDLSDDSPFVNDMGILATW